MEYRRLGYFFALVQDGTPLPRRRDGRCSRRGRSAFSSAAARRKYCGTSASGSLGACAACNSRPNWPTVAARGPQIAADHFDFGRQPIDELLEARAADRLACGKPRQPRVAPDNTGWHFLAKLARAVAHITGGEQFLALRVEHCPNGRARRLPRRWPTASGRQSPDSRPRRQTSWPW